MTKKDLNAIYKWLLLACLIVFSGCSSCGGGGSKQVTVSWGQNHETYVNTIGGGYTVYYSTTQGFDIGSADSVDVPYVSGASTPTSTDIGISDGTWYIKVTAYGINLNGEKVISPPSDEYTLQVGG